MDASHHRSAIVDRYELGPPLGRGGSGTVHRARDRQTGVEIALKRLAPDVPADIRRRFVAEARIARRLTSPYIARLLDAGDDDDRGLWAAFEWVEGPTLRALIEDGRLEPMRAVRLARHLAHALAEAHAAGVVHRDLKPENVMVARAGTDDESARLLDFGVAYVTDASVRLTATGYTVGTAGYMAPEQLAGEPIDGRSDLYALGVLLFEMCTGTPPFRSATSHGLGLRHLHDPPPPMSEIAPELLLLPSLPTLQELVDRLLAKERDDRPANGDEVGAALAAIERGEPGTEAPPMAPRATTPNVGPPRSRRWLALPAAVTAGAAIGFALGRAGIDLWP